MDKSTCKEVQEGDIFLGIKVTVRVVEAKQVSSAKGVTHRVRSHVYIWRG